MNNKQFINMKKAKESNGIRISMEISLNEDFCVFYKLFIPIYFIVKTIKLLSFY